jgi:phospholipid/cholesterol/gamma-HCH transport system substrate-binding protein
MSRKANPTVIGLFIVLGLALGIGSVLLVSSSKIFTQTRKYILYFDASLTGLDPGTAVKFRGVTIGSVKEVLIHFNQAPADSSLPVIIELNENLLKKRSDQTFNLTDDAQFKAFVTRGMRGKLEAQSLLTGLLYVELDFLPETPPIYHQVKKLYSEIPTAPTDIQIFRVDFAGIAQKLNAVLAKLDTSLGEFQMREINHGLSNLLASLNTVVSSPELTNTLGSAHQTFDEFRLLSQKLRYRVDPLADGADQTLAESRQTLAELRQGVQDVRDLLAPHAPLRQDLNAALEQLTESARSIGALADFLTRHPNALLSGRKAPESKP